MDQALQKLDDQLKCPICLEIYSEPKVLKCNHVFCKKCLKKVWNREEVRSNTYAIVCPSCRKYTTLGHQSSVTALSPAFHINCLLDLKGTFEKVKEERRNTVINNNIVEEKKETEKSNKANRSSDSCQIHEGKAYELFCISCDTLICSHCVFRGEEHHSHTYEVIDEAYPQQLQQITGSLEPLQKRLELIKEELEKTEICRKDIVQRQTTIQEEIRREMRELRKILEVREDELVGTLNDMSQKKLRGVTVVKDHLVQSQTQIESCIEFVKEKLDTESKVEVMGVKASLLRQTEELSQLFGSENPKLLPQVDMAYTGNLDLKALCETIGKVVSPGLPHPEKTLATGKGLIEATVGQLQTITVQAINAKFRPCEEPIDSLQAKLTSEITGESCEATVNVENQKLGMYTITFCPVVQGEHKLEVTLDNQHIKESPFTIHARMHKIYSTVFLTMKDFSGPQGIAIADNGDIFVTEYFKHRILVLNSRGKELRSFGTCGSNNGQLEYPRGLAFDGDGHLLVADSDNHRIQRFTQEGEFIASVGRKGVGGGPLQFPCPTDIAFSAKTKKIYVLDANCRVHILNSDFTQAGAFGRRGQRDGQFNHPSGIACDSTGQVYITDCNRNDVQIFSPEGKFLRCMSKTFKCPNGITIDAQDHIYVCDGKLACVSRVNVGGALVAVLDMQEEGGGSMRRAMAVNKSGMVYVCGQENNREIKVY